MTESTTQHETTEHETETGRVALDKSGVDPESTSATAVGAGGPEAGAEDTDASTDSRPGRKRGRRARRAAAAAEQDAAEAPETSPAGKAAKGKKGAKGAKSVAVAGAGDRDGAGTAAGPRFDGRRLGHVIIGLLVVAVLLAVLLLVQLIKGPGNAGKLEKQEDRGDSARQAADSVIPKLYSYDYRQIDANTAEQVQLTTGAISDQIRTDTAPALKQLAPQTKAVVQAVSLGSAVLDDSGPDVQVLVYLNQAVSSNLLPAPRLDRNRVVATMRLVDGQWKVADIKAL